MSGALLQQAYAVLHSEGFWDLERLEVEVLTQQQLLASLRLKSVSASNDPGSTGDEDFFYFSFLKEKHNQTNLFFLVCILELVVHFRLRIKCVPECRYAL